MVETVKVVCGWLRDGCGEQGSRCPGDPPGPAHGQSADTAWARALWIWVPPTPRVSCCWWVHVCVLLAMQLLALWEACRFKASDEKSSLPLLETQVWFRWWRWCFMKGRLHQLIKGKEEPWARCPFLSRGTPVGVGWAWCFPPSLCSHPEHGSLRPREKEVVTQLSLEGSWGIKRKGTRVLSSSGWHAIKGWGWCWLGGRRSILPSALPRAALCF